MIYIALNVVLFALVYLYTEFAAAVQSRQWEAVSTRLTESRKISI